ncbi:rhodanese-like domain-containing protein [Fulvivirga sediminis]|uniref:Rhodanese-like domain-containing protein n=1 Tax=Fulvivirga sediminis TaxID=2803949 RepID=A0A937F7N2_9BACT|nr:rhodanese-like domain-containing protein [Fulvivirga sediminis]MBL3655588.1 rhodanese-like domain-containing protein [Fulvivirga sediminis]
MKEIEVTEYKERVKNDSSILIIDVRECWEYDENNIGVTNYPLGELPQYLNKLPSNKDHEIIIHCESGRRSRQAAKYLTQQGYTKVSSIKGGLKAILLNS